MQNLHITKAIEDKLARKHNVQRREVEQCFLNRAGRLLEDTRARHKTQPPTLWFLAQTNQGRWLKVVFVPAGGHIELKTAYSPNEDEIRLYKKHG
jgi:hypothetical protein